MTMPTRVALPGPASIVAAGYMTACAVVGGEVWCWGDNGDGEIGDGTMTDRYSPVRIQGLTSVTSIARTAYRTCAVSGGNVYCWGWRYLGDGVSDSQSLVPKLILDRGSDRTGYGRSAHLRSRHHWCRRVLGVERVR